MFLAGAGTGIAYGAAIALDGQGKPEFANLATGGSTQEHRVALNKQVTTEKRPLAAGDLAWVRADAVRGPLEGTPYYLMGASRALQGDRLGARRLVDLSMARDPRLLPPRYWNVRTAMEEHRAGDATDAMFRIIALDRASLLQAIPVLVQLSRFPESWPHIRAGLAKGGNWRELYFSGLVTAGFDPGIIFNAIDVPSNGGRSQPSVREQNSLLGSMIAKGDYERAYTAWLGWLPPQALTKVAFVYDGDFTGATGAPPFNWTYTSGEAGSAEADSAEKGGLRFDLTPRDPVRLASQIVLLAPGRYRLGAVAMLDQRMRQGEAVPVQWRLRCLAKPDVGAQLALPDSVEAKAVSTEFEIPPECPAQLLSLEGSAMEFPIRTGGSVRKLTITQLQ